MTPDEEVSFEHLKWVAHVRQLSPEKRRHDVKAKLESFVDDANRQPPAASFRALLPPSKFYMGDVTDAHVEAICDGFDKGLPALAEGTFIVKESEPSTRIAFYCGALTPEGRFNISVVAYGDPVLQAAIALEQHFARSGLTGDRIRKCEECDSIFISDRKGQKYCSPACGRAVANRDFYQREKKATAAPKRKSRRKK